MTVPPTMLWWVAGGGVLAYVVITYFPGAKTRRLAMTVWAAFGPYESADAAEHSLRQVCGVVFGPDGIGAHEEWIQGHVKNFRDWDRFARAQKAVISGLLLTAYGRAFKAACKAVQAERVEKAIEATETLNAVLSRSHLDVRNA